MQGTSSKKTAFGTSNTKTEEGKSYTVLIGDIMKSTAFPDQKTLFADLQKQFNWLNDKIRPAQKLQFTIGDEFQAAYSDIQSAFIATILLRLHFRSDELQKSELEDPNYRKEARIGLARGIISRFNVDEAPYGQSGDAWWNARKALMEVEHPKKMHREPHSMQTRFSDPDPLINSIGNSFWLAFDQIIYSMDKIDIDITVETLIGSKQRDISEKLGVVQSVISTRAKHKGTYTILRILNELGIEKKM